MVDAIPCLATDKAVELFGKYKVFSKAELESRVEIKYENYAKAINIEAKTMIDMASKQILPAVIGYTKSLADTILAVKGAGAPAAVQTDLLNDVSKLLEEAKAALVTLEEVTDKAAEAGDMAAEARYFHESVVPAMAALRTPIDKLEVLVDKKVWPMPILFRSAVRSIKNVKIQWFPHPVIPSQKVMKGTEINKRFLSLFDVQRFSQADVSRAWQDCIS